MDANGNIYAALDDIEIPAEDKARLDGYLRGKADDGERERLKAELDEIKRQVAALEGEER